MRVKNHPWMRYMVCPNRTSKRYSTIPQLLDIDGVTWHCMMCGADHYDKTQAAKPTIRA